MSPTIKKKKTSVGKKITPRVIKAIEVKPEKLQALPVPSLRLYRRIVGGFIAVVVLVFGAVILLSTTKATIEITPLTKTIESSFLTEVVKTGAVEGEINGTVVEQTFKQAESFPVTSGEQKEVLAKAGGVVKIINNSSKIQPLVATTRLLSSGGALFRLDKGVTVPAGGSVEAVVYADQVGPTGDISPDKFTIPGLSTSLQSSIFGESTVAMSGGRKVVSVVTQEELDKDAETLSNEMLAVAKDQLRLLGKNNLSGEAFLTEVISKESDTEPGEEKDTINISLTTKVTAVFFEVAELNKMTWNKLYEDLDEGFVFIKDPVDSQAPINKCVAMVEITQGNATNGTAELRATIKKDSVVANTSPFLQPEVFVGKTPEEVKAYLVSAGVAKDVTVNIFPPWSRKVPSMVDHITILVTE
ncbi:MAG: hypothetical protein V1664_03850 [Candidatus Uhrbacteria bacterium]